MNSTIQKSEIKEGANAGNETQRQPGWQLRLTPSYDFDLGNTEASVFGTITAVDDRWSDPGNTVKLDGYEKGWNIKYLTDFPSDPNYYLRGEEYSSQIDEFVAAIADRQLPNTSDFRSAAETDYTISMIISDAPRVDRIAKTAQSDARNRGSRARFGLA